METTDLIGTRKTGFAVGTAALVLLAGWLWYDEASGARAVRRARSDDAEVRLTAIADLAGRDSDLAREALEWLTGDTDPRVASAAVRALGDNARPEQLRNVLTGAESGRVRGAAARALAERSPDDLALVMQTLRTDVDPDARAGAARGLGQSRRRAALSALLEALDDSEASVRVQAITAMNAILLVRLDYNAAADPAERRTKIEAIRGILSSAGSLAGQKAVAKP